MSRTAAFVLSFFLAASSLLIAQPSPKHDSAEAIRLANLGVALINQQRMDKAVERFDEALKLDPSLHVAELDKGIALLNLQKLKEAEVSLNRVAAVDPKNPRVWYNLGLVHRSQGLNEAGIADFKKVLAIDDHDADAYYLLGSMYLQLQQYDPAIEAFQSALKITPLHASAEFGLARALQRSGKLDEARIHLKNFEHLTREKISTPMTLAYGEQGRYSTAQDITPIAPQVGPMIDVKFSSVALTTSSAKAASVQGGGVCTLDVDGDGREDLVIAGGDALQVLLNKKDGTFKSAAPAGFGLAAKGQPVACAVGDYDNDDRADLAVAFGDHVELFRDVGAGKFTNVTKEVGIEPVNAPAALTFVDYDHDGDLDLIVAGTSNNGSASTIVWRNNGNSTFKNVTADTGINIAASTQVILSDLNNDRAVDIILTGSQGAPVVFSNKREGKFVSAPLYTEQLPPTVGIAIVDFNKDGWMDVALTHAGAPGITLWKNLAGKGFERVSLPDLGATKGWGIASIDFDNDGFLDLAAVLETAKGPKVRLLRNQGTQGFADVSNSVSLNATLFASARSLIIGDFDHDGDSDLLVGGSDGNATLLRNDGGNKNHSLRLSFIGLADSKSGLGTKLEVFADGLWQKWELAGSTGYMGQGSSEILVGLGKQTRVDIVRMLWPTGVLQDETEIAVDKPISFTELDRRGSSCPTLFAWNGQKYEFISDVIGAAVVGHWISPTEKNIADPDEWLKIEGHSLKAKDGFLSLRFGEPMEEVNYIDKVRLVAVDHPAKTEVYPNERFLSNPPFPEERTIVSSAAHAPVAAWDSQGKNVLELLRARDHRYVHDFQLMKFAGYANQHSLTLDLGAWTPKHPLRLFLHGFIEYFTATSMYAAWQAGIDPVAPYLEAQAEDGSWHRMLDDMGFPAGLPRTIVVDLTGKLPAGTRRIRISSNLQIYWDQVLVDNAADNQTVHQTELPLATASLAFRGYPRQVEGSTPGDLNYLYDQVSQSGPFSRQRGSYTRYGDVTPLLTNIDEHFVIFGSGEDIDVEFDSAKLPPLPKGWNRDYFFYANGFVKDMDFYEASPFTVSDLPFHKMSGYPYAPTEHYPDDDATVEYRLDWNDRFDSGTKAPGFKFEYRPRRQ
jgi:tetratricopeptide (TPR) repeat protein